MWKKKPQNQTTIDVNYRCFLNEIAVIFLYKVILQRKVSCRNDKIERQYTYHFFFHFHFNFQLFTITSKMKCDRRLLMLAWKNLHDLPRCRWSHLLFQTVQPFWTCACQTFLSLSEMFLQSPLFMPNKMPRNSQKIMTLSWISITMNQSL